MAKIFTTVEKQWDADVIVSTLGCRVDGSEDELFGTYANIYGHRLRRLTDYRSRVCFSLCVYANVIVGSQLRIMYGPDFQNSHELEMSNSRKKAFRSVRTSDMFKGVASPACSLGGMLYIELIPKALCPRPTSTNRFWES